MYNITGGKDLTLQEVNRVSEVVTSMADPNANIIFGEHRPCLSGASALHDSSRHHGAVLLALFFAAQGCGRSLHCLGLRGFWASGAVGHVRCAPAASNRLGVHWLPSQVMVLVAPLHQHPPCGSLGCCLPSGQMPTGPHCCCCCCCRGGRG